jgi:hypothetical protein
MKNKYGIKLVSLAIGSVTLLSSCSYYTSTVKAEKALADIQIGVVSQSSLQQKEKKDQLKNSMVEALKSFFSNYYKIDDVILLEANKLPKSVDDKYINYYDNYYIAMLKSLGNYMSDDLKQQLSVGFYTSKLDLPRFVQVNGSTIVSYKDIADIDFNVLKNTDNRYELQVNVDVNVDAVQNDVFNKKYIYLPSEGYYRDLGAEFSQQDLDQYKVRVAYYVNCTITEEKFVIDKLVEKSDFFIDKQKKHKKENNNFIARLPYKEEPTDEERIPVEEFFNHFFAQDYDSLKYFSDMKNASFSMVSTYFENNLKAKALVLLDETTFKNKFPTSISPVKDAIVQVEKTGEVTFNSCIDSSLNHQKYYVEIPVNAKYLDGSTANRIYVYTVEVNKKSGLYRIEALEYVSSRKLSEEVAATSNSVKPTQSTTENSKKVEPETANSLKDLGV